MAEALSQHAQGQLKRQLVAYFLATFAFSWGIFAAALALGFAQSPIVILGVWGPTLSAMAVTAVFYGKGGLKRFLGRTHIRKGLQWFLPLLGFFLVLGLTGVHWCCRYRHRI